MTIGQENAVIAGVEAKLTPSKKTSSRGKLGWIPVALFALAAYWYSDVIFFYAGANDECLKFAEGADINPAFKPDPTDSKLFVADKWIKGNKVVVEIGQKSADKKGYFNSRLCVVGGGKIMIPGMFEEWQYK